LQGRFLLLFYNSTKASTHSSYCYCCCCNWARHTGCKNYTEKKAKQSSSKKSTANTWRVVV